MSYWMVSITLPPLLPPSLLSPTPPSLAHSSPPNPVPSLFSLPLMISYVTEILDYGYPQKTDSGILKTYITQQGVRSQVHCPV